MKKLCDGVAYARLNIIEFTVIKNNTESIYLYIYIYKKKKNETLFLAHIYDIYAFSVLF